MIRILVIDDEVQMRQMLKQMLEKEGYEVVIAEDGKEGLKIFREKPTDLIITDIIMPEKDGIEMMLELAKEFPAVRIIAISGGSRAIDSQDCLSYSKQLGVKRALSKPFERRELLDAVRAVTIDLTYV